MLKVTLTAEECVREEYPAGEWVVKWEHNDGENGRGTLCDIRVYRGEGDPLLYRMAMSRCHPSDHYCRETGRRQSLAKVLAMIWPDVPVNVDGAEFWGKDVKIVNARQKATRTMFWDAYWAQKTVKSPVNREKSDG